MAESICRDKIFVLNKERKEEDEHQRYQKNRRCDNDRPFHQSPVGLSVGGKHSWGNNGQRESSNKSCPIVLFYFDEESDEDGNDNDKDKTDWNKEEVAHERRAEGHRSCPEEEMGHEVH